MRICVYCASSSQAPAHFGEAAFELGALLASQGRTIVYGGGGMGSMRRLADGALSAGGRVVGVMPRFMRDLEWSHPDVDEIHWTDDMAQRKRKLVELSDAVVALPGGCGTFEELLEVLTLKRLGLYVAPVVIVNQAGFYDPLVALFERSVAEQFMDERHLAMYRVVDAVEQVPDALRNAPPWSEDARSFATKP